MTVIATLSTLLCLSAGLASKYGMPNMGNLGGTGDCPASSAHQFSRFEGLARPIGRPFRCNRALSTEKAEFPRLLPRLIIVHPSSINHG